MSLCAMLPARARAGAAWLLQSWRRLFGTALALAAAGMVAIALFAWSGLYSVAASSGHWAVVELLLRFGMESSVRTHAPALTPPDLGDESLIRLGAGHFHAGCAFCHGSPGTPVGAAALWMLPPPPELSGKMAQWTDQELFWIVRHGIKYTGMPAWPVQGRDDEVWALVAFLRRLPALDAESYAALALGEIEPKPETARQIVSGEDRIDTVEACARCHGLETGPRSQLVPVLHGQSREMLEAALRAYRSRERDSGIMQVAAAELGDKAIRDLAAFYARLPVPAVQAPMQDENAIERGAVLAAQGDPGHQIPACLSCHGDAGLPAYPRLSGQPARYLAGQLQAWRAGFNARTPGGTVMAPIARRLTPQQVADAALYFASLPLAAPQAARP
jgi:cytochrome c553